MKRISHCATCGREFDGESHVGVFCSDRCRLLDLGNWLDERYVIPGPASAHDGALDDTGDAE